MPIQFTEEDGGKILVVHVSGKLEKLEYAGFVPVFERLVMLQGKLRVLFELTDFHGWEAGVVWEDMKFASRCFSDIVRLAMIGDMKWQHGMTILSKPFTKAAVRYYDQVDAVEARRWLEEV